MPDHVFYRGVTQGDVPEIIASLKDGSVVERFVVPDALFDDPGKVRGR
jgi:(2Fe-2S) ferredoxin